MPRKGAPQPLALNTAVSANSPPASLPQTQTQTQTQTQMQAQARDRQASLATETSPLGVSPGTSLSPPDSRSSRSPRSSPFSSKFAPRRPHTSRGALQSTTSQPQSANPSPIRADHETAYLPIEAALHQEQQDPQTTPVQAVPPDSAPLRHVQTEGVNAKKSTKSGFFGLGNKVTKAAHSQFHVSYQPESRGRMDSREAAETGSSKHEDSEAGLADHSLDRYIPSHASRSNLSLSIADDNESASAPASARRTKPKPFALLTRSKSIRDRERIGSDDIPAPLPISATNPELHSEQLPLRTAPATHQDRAFRDMMNSNTRNRSADRVPTRDSTAPRELFREKEHKLFPPQPPHRENGGSNFFSGLRNSSTKAADMISKGLFGKSSRSGSTHDREPTTDDDHYVFKVINLPLVAQTRKTRISKRLEDSRDKTEFWMPAFPWRAIDYLNYRGCEVEGLYRVPGSGPQIKKWQRRFDEDHDVNLFEEETLYDINILGSMLKAWLRELPDELFPKAAQERIARECAGAEEVPQMLVDELSNLPPYQYYLLFAITCHLSLLLANSDKNKMDFRNLCICFQPCMKIDAFSFKFLVCDWRDCWKGCKTETKYIEEEYRLLDEGLPSAISSKPEQQSEPQAEEKSAEKTSTDEKTEVGERQASLSEDTEPPSNHLNGGQKGETRKKQIPLSESDASLRSISSISTALTGNSDHETGRANNGDMRPLSPIKPLSPIGF